MSVNPCVSVVMMQSNAMMSMVDEEPFPEHEPVYIGVNSFGLGGAYGHAILTPYKPHTVRDLPLDKATADNLLHLIRS